MGPLQIVHNAIQGGHYIMAHAYVTLLGNLSTGKQGSVQFVIPHV